MDREKPHTAPSGLYTSHSRRTQVMHVSLLAANVRVCQLSPDSCKAYNTFIVPYGPGVCVSLSSTHIYFLRASNRTMRFHSGS